MVDKIVLAKTNLIYPYFSFFLSIFLFLFVSLKMSKYVGKNQNKKVKTEKKEGKHTPYSITLECVRNFNIT